MRKKFMILIAAAIIVGTITGANWLELHPLKETVSNWSDKFYATDFLQQRETYVKKRVEDPYRILELELAAVQWEKRNGYSAEIESREFRFHNGDLYWHDKITSANKGKGLTYVIDYEGMNGTLTYYSEEAGKWIEEQELTEGRLPAADLFLTIGNKYIFLNQPFVYQDLGWGVVKSRNNLCREITVKKTAKGFQLQMFFENRPGIWGEIWALESDYPLMDLGYKAMRQIWVGYEYTRDSRWLMDGAYYITPESYIPYDKDSYWKNPAAYVVSGFVLTGGSRAADDLGYAQLYIQAQNLEIQGYMKTLPRSDWLYKDYGIEAGFFDTRFNTDLGVLFIEAYRKFNEARFLDYALHYGNFFKKFADEYHYTLTDPSGEEGWLVQDYYHEKENYRLPHTSLNHQLYEIRFLYMLGEITGDSCFKILGNKMLKGIEITCDSWIKEDNNLHYCYYSSGEFGGEDYPYLTYNDLFNLQKLLEDTGIGRSQYLQKLMDAKQFYMDANGITAYKK